MTDGPGSPGPRPAPRAPSAWGWFWCRLGGCGRGAGALAAAAAGPREQPVPRAEEPCVYKYPKKKHFNALLSDMMNELTKIFMRARELLSDVGRRRGAGRLGDGHARFRVVSSKNSPYFDGVYANMTIQYKKFYEKALEKGSERTGRDPCRHQGELRRLWGAVLDASHAALRAAALRCVRQQLDHEGRARDSKYTINQTTGGLWGSPMSDTPARTRMCQPLKNRVGQFLLKEFGRFRSQQLDLLCHEYALCYKDLLHYNETQKFDS
ncbi:hypothetical protein MSG28_004887 [Choristoneura fumiferana]|uniref:Uncharacterized protein n=1 Tax=Choristoneura fumiferana TaxID=7141 RepID=A0ACC0JP22_CHOFU|nr:hypothetical protein MSG28_004887 [Choristoneura fumiferana]